jgi:hypothetical protein
MKKPNTFSISLRATRAPLFLFFRSFLFLTKVAFFFFFIAKADIKSTAWAQGANLPKIKDAKAQRPILKKSSPAKAGVRTSHFFLFSALGHWQTMTSRGLYRNTNLGGTLSLEGYGAQIGYEFRRPYRKDNLFSGFWLVGGFTQLATNPDIDLELAGVLRGRERIQIQQWELQLGSSWQFVSRQWPQKLLLFPFVSEAITSKIVQSRDQYRVSPSLRSLDSTSSQLWLLQAWAPRSSVEWEIGGGLEFFWKSRIGKAEDGEFSNREQEVQYAPSYLIMTRVKARPASFLHLHFSLEERFKNGEYKLLDGSSQALKIQQRRLSLGIQLAF